MPPHSDPTRLELTRMPRFWIRIHLVIWQRATYPSLYEKHKTPKNLREDPFVLIFYPADDYINIHLRFASFVCLSIYLSSLVCSRYHAPQSFLVFDPIHPRTSLLAYHLRPTTPGWEMCILTHARYLNLYHNLLAVLPVSFPCFLVLLSFVACGLSALPF